jgi:hypothetical protein
VDGYTYLTRQGAAFDATERGHVGLGDRQVAAFDATERGHVGLGDYYSQRGESPGRWAGHGLPGLGRVIAGQFVGDEDVVGAAVLGDSEDGDVVQLYRSAPLVAITAQSSAVVQFTTR